MSRFDRYYRRSLLSKVFINGWGNPDLLLRIIEAQRIVSKRETCKNLINSFNVQIKKKSESGNCLTIEGSFISPFYSLIPESMDENNRIARFQLIIPKSWHSKYKPLVIHYPSTGDHHYSRRKSFLAARLLKSGIASLIHISPFYGNRKPKNQKGAVLNYLSDLFVMGGSLILETNVLLQWAKNEGFDPLAVHGISMGGHMACLGVSVYPEPVCLIPCLSWTTASHVFTKGAISSSVSWNILSNQINNDEVFLKKLRPAIEPPVPLKFKNLEQSKLKTQDKMFSKQENNKLENPFNKLVQKTNFVIPNKENVEVEPLQFDSREIIKNDNFSKFQSFRNNFIWNLSIELFSIMRSFTESDKITKEELENIHTQEIEIKRKQSSENYFSQSIPVDKETVEFMRDILDYFTHLGNYSVPVDTRLATIAVARNDAYVPMEGVAHFHDVWDSRCDIRVREGMGHIEAYLRCSLWTDDLFREAIIDTINRYIELYYNEKGPFSHDQL